MKIVRLASADVTGLPPRRAVWINAKIELVEAFKTSAGNAGGTKPSVRVGGWRELAQSLDPSVEARVCLTRIQAREPSVGVAG